MATLKKPSWVYSFCGVLFLVGVIMTCSRTSIVCALVIYALSFLVLCKRSRNRRSTIIMNVILFGGLLAYMLLFQYDILLEYLEIFTIHRSVGSRLDGFVAGIQQFLKYPVFGGSFYATDYKLEEWSKVENFTSFFPGLWHNTIIQIGASCGIVGLVGYAWHRFQTIWMIWKKPATANLFTGLSILAMLAMSLFDCHIFNIGPALFYSMSLAFVEKHSKIMKHL
jgi:O-antigen ligase